MSLLKVNEVQNYNGSSLTLTASTVSTSAQLNTGGNISVTGSINVSDDSTTRSNLGLGSIATQTADNVAITGGSVTGTEIDLKSSGTTIFASDGTTSIVSESSGTVTVDNAIVGNDYTGILEVDQWYLTANVGAGDITANWARNNFTGFSKIGTGLTESSGVFTFPRTGVYEIIPAFILSESTGGSDANVGIFLRVSVDNGSNFISFGHMQGFLLDNTFESMVTASYILNVNNITGSNTVQFKFLADSLDSGNFINGLTTYMRSHFTIKRLGPAQ